MMKTPDEIKNGLECCVQGNVCRKNCPYGGSPHGIVECTSRLSRDALALIQQKEKENAEQAERIRQLEQSLSFARDLADGLKAATVKQEQELYVSETRNWHLEAQNAELLKKVEQLQAERLKRELQMCCVMRYLIHHVAIVK